MGQTCGPQGVLEPKICANGHYCPDGKSEILCPKGTFCPSGSQAPFNCTRGSLCPEGSVNQVVLAPVWVTLILDALLGVLVAIGFGISKWRKSRPKKYAASEGTSIRDTEMHEQLLRSTKISGGQMPPISSPAIPGNVSPASSQTLSPQFPHVAHMRRDNGRVDNMDGYTDDDQVSTFDEDEIDADFQSNPDFQRFIRSVSKSITTQSIGLSFDFENLAFETKRGKKILQEVTGTMPRGSMWGVMGGSGAGKSTFLNVLMGKKRATGGTVKINGWSKDIFKYRKLIGYVPQDDIVFPELTVRENILHSARCRLPARWKDREIQDHVDSLLACLQLTHVRHMRVGDARKPVISGGQRKRVNIGIELAAAPMAIFLDEPTSGLDATSASSIMRLLKAVSKLGVTVIAIVHQPREKIFYEFDQLLLLASGRSVYSGPTDRVRDYFETMGFAFPRQANPADTLMDIITGDGAQYAVGSKKRDVGVQYLIDQWKQSGQYTTRPKHLSIFSSESQSTFKSRESRRISNQSLNSTVEQENELHRTMQCRGASWPAQAYYCFKRAMTQQVRNATSFFFEIGVGGLAGLVIGLSAFASKGHLFQGLYHEPFTLLSSAVDYQGTPQLGLLGGMAIGLAASAPGFWVFGEEKLIYWRETASGHSRSAYYVGKLLSTLPRIALSSLHFTIFLSVLATPLISFTEMYAANLMYFWCVYGLASCVAMVVKRENGPLLASLGSLIIGVLGGVAPPLSKVKGWHLEWFWRLSPGVWFTEAYFSQNIMPLAYLYKVDLAAESVGYTLDQYHLDIG